MAAGAACPVGVATCSDSGGHMHRRSGASSMVWVTRANSRGHASSAVGATRPRQSHALAAGSVCPSLRGARWSSSSRSSSGDGGFVGGLGLASGPLLSFV